jgi:hypothetical protein
MIMGIQWNIGYFITVAFWSALLSNNETDVTSFGKMEEVLNGCVTILNPTLTPTLALTLTKIIK